MDCRNHWNQPEWISVTLGPVACLWQDCWMQSPVTANHNLKTQATLFCKSCVYIILFQKVLQGNADSQAGQSYIEPALEELTQYVEWEIQFGSVVSVWGLPSVCDSLLCPLSHDISSWKANHSCSVLFYRELRTLLKLESWDSCRGTDTAQSEPSTECSSGLPALPSENISEAFLAKNPFLMSLPYLAVLVSEWTWSKGYCCWKREALFPQLPPTFCCFYCLWLSSGALINWCSLLICQTTKEAKQKNPTFSGLANRNVCSEGPMSARKGEGRAELEGKDVSSFSICQMVDQCVKPHL